MTNDRNEFLENFFDVHTVEETPNGLELTFRAQDGANFKHFFMATLINGEPEENAERLKKTLEDVREFESQHG